MPVPGEIADPERPCEARGRPPKGEAWLSGDMVSQTNRVSTFGKALPLRAILCLPRKRGDARRRPRERTLRGPIRHPGDHFVVRWMCAGPPGLSQHHGREPAVSRSGCRETGTYVTTLECIISNAGSGHRDAKAGSPPMPGDRGGAAVVVRGRESRPHGEGRQFVGKFLLSRAPNANRRDLRGYR